MKRKPTPHTGLPPGHPKGRRSALTMAQQIAADGRKSREKPLEVRRRELAGIVAEAQAALSRLQPISARLATPAPPVLPSPPTAGATPASVTPAPVELPPVPPAPDPTPPAPPTPPPPPAAPPPGTFAPVSAGPVPPAPNTAPLDPATAKALEVAEGQTRALTPPPEAPSSGAPARPAVADVPDCTPERAGELTRGALKHAMRGGATIFLTPRAKRAGFGVIDTWRFVPPPTPGEIDPIYRKLPPEIEAFVRRHAALFALGELGADLIEYGERAAQEFEGRLERALERRAAREALAKARAQARPPAAPSSPPVEPPDRRIVPQPPPPPTPAPKFETE